LFSVEGNILHKFNFSFIINFGLNLAKPQRRCAEIIKKVEMKLKLIFFILLISGNIFSQEIVKEKIDDYLNYIGIIASWNW
jgi:hypothetical protein